MKITSTSTAVTWITGDMLIKYDHNKDGVISLKAPRGKTGVPGIDERVRASEGAGQSYTRLDVFNRADVNKDQIVTREELDDAIKAYDQDGDGQLKSTSYTRNFWEWLTRKPKPKSGGDLDTFNQQAPEKTISQDTLNWLDSQP